MVETTATGPLAKTVRPLSRLRRLAVNLTLAAGSLMVFLVLLEIAFRIFWPQIRAPQIFESGPGGITVKLQPNVQGYYYYPEYTHAIETNSRGLRGRREYAYAKPPETYRILVLGDSFTMGPAVEFEQAYTSLLEERLGRAGGQPIEVINAGTPGWSTSEELIYFQEEARKYRPDLVVLAFCDNDVSTNLNLGLFSCEGAELQRRRARAHDPVSSGRQWTQWIPGYSYVVQHSHPANFVRVTLVRAIWAANPSAVQDRASQMKAWELTLALLRQFIREVRSTGAETIVLYVPEKPLHRPRASHAGSLYRTGRYTDLANHQVLSGICHALNVGFVNLLPALLNAGESDCYYAQDTHWRARGHEVAAAELEEVLRGRIIGNLSLNQ